MPDVGSGANDDRWGTWWGEIYFVPEPAGIWIIGLLNFWFIVKRGRC